MGAILAAAIAALMAGCWPWHSDPGPTPQDRFIKALAHGNSAQAAEIWRNMTPEDRAAFSRSEGMKPQASDEEVRKQLEKRYAEQTGEQAEDAGGSISSQMQEISPMIQGGSLRDLPGYGASPGTAPSAAIVIP